MSFNNKPDPGPRKPGPRKGQAMVITVNVSKDSDGTWWFSVVPGCGAGIPPGWTDEQWQAWVKDISQALSTLIHEGPTKEESESCP